MSSNKKDQLDSELQVDVNSFDLIDYNNIYDDLNQYYVNSYDDKDTSLDTQKNNKSLSVVSNDDSIEFVHNDDVSERHKQIHEEKKAKEKAKENTKKKKTSTSSKKSTTKKEPLYKSTGAFARSVSNTSSSTTSTSSRNQSRPDVEAYSNKNKKKEKKPSGCLWIFILFFILPNLFTSCDDLTSSLEDILTEEFSTILDYEQETEEEEEIVYEGEKSDLKTVYETSDTDHQYPYYYDFDGNVYDWEYKLITYWSACEFPKETMAEIKILWLTSSHKNEEGFITAFADPVTYEAYYVIAGSFYDENDNLVAIGDINVPTNVLLEITNYHNEQIQGN